MSDADPPGTTSGSAPPAQPSPAPPAQPPTPDEPLPGLEPQAPIDDLFDPFGGVPPWDAPADGGDAPPPEDLPPIVGDSADDLADQMMGMLNGPGGPPIPPPPPPGPTEPVEGYDGITDMVHEIWQRNATKDQEERGKLLLPPPTPQAPPQTGPGPGAPNILKRHRIVVTGVAAVVLLGVILGIALGSGSGKPTTAPTSVPSVSTPASLPVVSTPPSTAATCSAKGDHIEMVEMGDLSFSCATDGQYPCTPDGKYDGYDNQEANGRQLVVNTPPLDGQSRTFTVGTGQNEAEVELYVDATTKSYYATKGTLTATPSGKVMFHGDAITVTAPETISGYMAC